MLVERRWRQKGATLPCSIPLLVASVCLEQWPSNITDKRAAGLTKICIKNIFFVGFGVFILAFARKCFEKNCCLFLIWVQKHYKVIIMFVHAAHLINYCILFVCVCYSKHHHHCYCSAHHCWMDHRLHWHCVQVLLAHSRHPRWWHVLHCPRQAGHHQGVWIQQWNAEFHRDTWLDGESEAPL